ncbi:putative Heat shock 70 kDa protein-like protein [Hypsibius exemplaris]|uniref:Hypoxia up-regulated protein 1 n=1 Tax=Hypsibius exemplaris TaxID=2072580 RepID=A0A1W0X9U8_HYPEX|nr:putative Heat shock 70 kDa protein-like protein [Hypsibius exemplaris]
MAAVGIDFGLANIRVAKLWPDGKLDIHRNSYDGRKSPTYLVLENSRYAYGDEARAQSLVDIHSSAFDVLRFLGLTIEFANETTSKHHYPFSLIPTGPSSQPSFLLYDQTCQRQVAVTVAELVETLLQRTFMEMSVDVPHMTTLAPVVLTVPSWWTPSRIQQLYDCAVTAGCGNVRLVESRVAALFGCFLYSLDPSTFPKKVLLVDIGATGTELTAWTTDVHNDQSEIAYHIWFPDGGGNAVDWQLVQFCQLALPQCDFGQDPLAVHRVRLECQDAKHRMSPASKSTKIYVPNLRNNCDLNLLLDAESFEEIGRPFADSLMNLVNTALYQCSWTSEDEFQILLVGGGSRLPIIRRTFRHFYGSRINPSVLLYADEAAAYGAAGLASMFAVEPRLDGIGPLDVHHRKLCKLFRQTGLSWDEQSADHLRAFVSSHLASAEQQRHHLSTSASETPMQIVEPTSRQSEKQMLKDQPSNIAERWANDIAVEETRANTGTSIPNSKDHTYEHINGPIINPLPTEIPNKDTLVYKFEDDDSDSDDTNENMY